VTHRGPFQPLLFCDSVKRMLPHPLSSPSPLPERSVSADYPKRRGRMVLPSEVGLKAATNRSVFSKAREQ